jgi:small subunit ribosomal protein S16
MIKIRLSRVGTKNRPYYRIVAADERKKRSDSSLGVIGFWHPAKGVKKIDKKKLKSWIDKGAKLTSAVAKLLKE